MPKSRRKVLTLAAAGVVLGVTGCAQRSRPRPPVDSVQIGYGMQPKDKVVGAVTSLSEEDLAARPLRIEELLRGKVAGLEILRTGNAITFRIRGTSSMLANQDALVIVDDVMIHPGNIAGALAGLTPDDIRKVNVLKDVASTSIYGQRGAGGVILITTTSRSKREEQGH